MAKKKTKRNPIPKVILIILIIVLIAAFAYIGYDYFAGTKNLSKASYEISNSYVADNIVKFDCEVLDPTDKVTSFDIDLICEHDHEPVSVVKESTKFNENISYSQKVEWNHQYQIRITLRKEIVFGMYAVETSAKEESKITIGANPNLGVGEDVVYDDFQIHFMELGNEYAGDSTYIKAGDVDILIDAGSRGSSATTIVDYVKNYCTDGKLEYVIATHSHQDHIAGFAGTSKSGAKNYKNETVGKTGVLYYFDIGTIIDFAYAEATPSGQSKQMVENKTQVSSSYGSSTEYGKYLAAREYAIEKGAKYYTAAECFNNTGEAKSSYELAQGITMNILYNYYYFNTSNDVNNYSVCTMFTYNKDSESHNFMLTGDLELEGETKLAEYYDGSVPAKTLPHVDLFKAGHHGSKTSSNEVLLSKITPDICCVCCCAGYNEYTVDYNNIFPTQEFINRIAKYTELVYVTSVYDEVFKEFKSMNGNIIISCNGKEIGRKASNNLTILKDTEWFNGYVYLDSSGKCATNVNKEFYTESTAGVTKRVRRTWPTY